MSLFPIAVLAVVSTAVSGEYACLWPEIEAADVAADRAWDAVRTPAELAYAEYPELFAGFKSLGDGTFGTAVREKSRRSE